MPKKCAICYVGTEGVPTFIVTQKRKDNWEYVVPIPLFVGDRICQTHFPKSFLIKENIKYGPEHAKRSRFMLRQKSLKLYREFLKTIKTIPLESDRQQFINWVKEDFKKNKFETDEYSIKTLHKYGEKSLTDLKLNLALSSTKIS